MQDSDQTTADSTGSNQEANETESTGNGETAPNDDSIADNDSNPSAENTDSDVADQETTD